LLVFRFVRVTVFSTFLRVNIHVPASSNQLREVNPPRFRTTPRRTSHQDSSWLGDRDFENSGLASRLAGKPHLQSSTPSTTQPTPAVDNNGEASNLPPSTPISTHSYMLRSERTTQSSISVGYHTRGDSRDNIHQTSPPGSRRITRRTPKRSPDLQLRRDNRTRSGNSDAHKFFEEDGPVLPPTSANFEATDLDQLFAKPMPTPTEPASDKRQGIFGRVQLTLEHKGGDYSRLLPKTIAGDKLTPVSCAQATIARRRDVGINQRIGALQIVESMVGKQNKPSEI
jgi:hypothetical protein